MTKQQIKKRLEYLRGELRAERISWLKHSAKGHISKHKTKKEANRAIPMIEEAL